MAKRSDESTPITELEILEAELRRPAAQPQQAPNPLADVPDAELQDYHERLRSVVRAREPGRTEGS